MGRFAGKPVSCKDFAVLVPHDEEKIEQFLSTTIDQAYEQGKVDGMKEEAVGDAKKIGSDSPVK